MKVLFYSNDGEAEIFCYKRVMDRNGNFRNGWEEKAANSKFVITGNNGNRPSLGSARTALGVKQDGTVIIFARGSEEWLWDWTRGPINAIHADADLHIDDVMTGIIASSVNRILTELGAEIILHLDGSGSTQLHANGTELIESFDDRRIHSIIEIMRQRE